VVNPFLSTTAARPGLMRPVPCRIAPQANGCFPELAAPFHRTACRGRVRITFFSARPVDRSSRVVACSTTRKSDAVTKRASRRSGFHRRRFVREHNATYGQREISLLRGARNTSARRTKATMVCSVTPTACENRFAGHLLLARIASDLTRRSTGPARCCP